jgi:hypothetical protein
MKNILTPVVTIIQNIIIQILTPPVAGNEVGTLKEPLLK